MIKDFLDHLLRAWPNTKFVAIKRSYFFGKEIADSFSMQLSNMACSVYRGIYQAIRPSLVRFPAFIGTETSNLPPERSDSQRGCCPYGVLQSDFAHGHHAPNVPDA